MSSVLILGLDGMTFRVLDRPVEAGVTPFIAELYRQGARGDLISTPNPMTALAWPSLTTGRNPGAHGCFDFFRSEERDGEMFFTVANGLDVHCETIWSIASRKGMRVTALNFPMTCPHPPICGNLVPGPLMSWKHMQLGIQPKELYQALKALPGFSYKEMAWDFDLGNKVADGIAPGEYESWVQHYTIRESHWFRAAQFLMRADPCPLTALLLDGPDKLFHICWRFIDPEYYPKSPSHWEQKLRKLCLDYFRTVDSYLEELVRMAGSRAHVFLVSDHGFRASTEVFRVNTWLAQKGYLSWRCPPGFKTTAEKEAWERRLNCNFVFLDWDRTLVYAPTSSANGLYIRVAKAPGGSGVRPEEYITFRNHLIDELYQVKHPQTGQRIVMQAHKKEEIYRGAQASRAPDLTLVLRDSGFISIHNRAPVVEPRTEIWGTHEKNGIFLGSGPGVHKGLRTGPLSILDIAPLVMYSMGLEIPAEFEGRVPLEIFNSSWLAEHPLRTNTNAGPEPSLPRETHGNLSDEEADAAIMKCMSVLGY